MENTKYLKLINFLNLADREVAVIVPFSRFKHEDIQVEFSDFINLVSMGNNTFEIIEHEDEDGIERIEAKVYVNNMVHEVIFTY